MRLADFIVANTARIAAEWEAAVPGFLPATHTCGSAVLLNAAPQLLAALAADIDAREAGATGATADAAMEALGRSAGFDVAQLTAEFLALRAGVSRMWRLDSPDAASDLRALNDAIDRALARSIAYHSERIERARSLFLAMLGHDLRTPLGAIDLGCQYLSRSDLAPERKSEAVARISRCAGAMNAMIKDMLEFTRSRLGTSVPVVPRPAHLGVICHGVLDGVRSVHTTREFIFEESGDLACRVDPGRLHQALWNLLNNALQNGLRERVIVLRACGEHDAVLLSVTHYGTVIPAAVLATIFDPVALLATANEDAGPPANLSLGLYIAREIVRAHGGDIEAASSEEAGTTLTIRLPKTP